MNIGIFTDTYYPQVSGVATSIKTLREQLESRGHNVYIFTTTDPKVDKNVFERNIFRFTSVPFVSFTDRRIAVRGLFQAYEIAKELNLDIVHTQTEFSMGLIGKFVAKNLKIPCVHTYHTMYEDYLHYVMKGKVLRPAHVKQLSKTFCEHMTGIIAPSVRVLETLTSYGVKEPITVIPTGVDITKFSAVKSENLREKYQIAPETPLLLTVSRVAFEKDIDRLINAFPEIQKRVPGVRLMICGDGPAKAQLEEQVAAMELTDQVIFTGEIDHDEVPAYYQMADLFVSTSISESQGLTFIEALAAGLKVVAASGPYTDELLDDLNVGATFETPVQFVEQTVEYLLHPQKYADNVVREKKVASISADNFGEAVLEFYQDCCAGAPAVDADQSRERI
ncbi:glycosyl transferase [Ligilactobacillus pabuli]|uniref:Glycosyl transferase n=1 Tax=Ligilactobacillus pabuli TaxID=2886039 RepID=A0ABQ5JFP6_9LACO|nr:glycosyltransferase family 4 protein [Ligilactobacillus pabuli]GKS80523.1 glycosyl transferase [Ligilactobacillus pabuli]HIW88693.1 glycosyltransferase family 4 protein [Candidatus Ligilactobacillus excrementipullorum]